MTSVELLDLRWDEVRPDESQPRVSFDPDRLSAMADTFRERGQITPARVRRDPSGPTPYVIVDGERRWRVGRTLHEKEPDNPLFATFRAYVDDVDAADLPVVQFLANSGEGHTPAERLAVLERVLADGTPVNKVRPKLGIPPRQFRDLKDFLRAPQWLRVYGAPRAVSVLLHDEAGKLVLDPDGRPKRNTVALAPLSLTHLAVLTRYATRLMRWDRELQQAHPQGEHQNVAQQVICRLADKALEKQLSVAKLSKMCAAATERATGAAPPDEPSADVGQALPTTFRPFTRDARGGLRIPTTDPARLDAPARAALADELETLAAELRRWSPSPASVAAASTARAHPAAPPEIRT